MSFFLCLNFLIKGVKWAKILDFTLVQDWFSCRWLKGTLGQWLQGPQGVSIDLGQRLWGLQGIITSGPIDQKKKKKLYDISINPYISFDCKDPKRAIKLSWAFDEAVDAYVNQNHPVGVNPGLDPKAISTCSKFCRWVELKRNKYSQFLLLEFIIFFFLSSLSLLN